MAKYYLLQDSDESDDVIVVKNYKVKKNDAWDSSVTFYAKDFIASLKETSDYNIEHLVKDAIKAKDSSRSIYFCAEFNLTVTELDNLEYVKFLYGK